MAGKKSRTFNLGTGTGFSVREVIEQVKIVTNKSVEIVEGARRAGDARKLVSGSTRASNELNWVSKRSNLEKIVKDAWHWYLIADYKQ